MGRLIRCAAVTAAMLVLPAASAVAAPTISITPASGAPGLTVTVSGTGFDPNRSVDVYLDTADTAIVASNASGAVSTSITIPPSAQPGKHWLTLEETSTHAAAQAPFTVAMNWPQVGWGPSYRGWNPLENTLNAANVSHLTEAWGQRVTGYGNPKPFVSVNGDFYVFDENETLHAFGPTGKLLWTAAPGTTFRYAQAGPTSWGGSVFVGDANGLIVAYPYLCRSDGGACTTHLWSRNIGTAVEGALTARNGLIYAPGADGLVHVLNASTGALGTSISSFGSGAITQPVAIGPDGSVYTVQGATASDISPVTGGGSTTFASGTALSQVAVGNGDAYATTTSGYLSELFGWTTSIGSTCDIPPAFADSVVYAASCTTIGAYDASTGALLWSQPTTDPASGLSVANGVLYACVGYRVLYYDTSYGGKLGSGIPCNGQPMVLQGGVYAVDASLAASTLNGAVTSAAGTRRATRRPNPRLLRPSPRLHRFARHRQRAARRSPRAAR